MAFTRKTQVSPGILSGRVRGGARYGLVIASFVVGVGTTGLGQSPPPAPAGNVAPNGPPPAQEIPAPPSRAKPRPAQPAAAQPQATNSTPGVPVGVTPPPDYVIGAQDVLTIVVWREKEMSGDVSVRPDGKISLPLMNEIHAAGRTPEQLRLELTQAAGRFIEDPTVTVLVKEIHSRKVYITGMVNRPGPYPLAGPTTVLQLLAMAGGVLEYADEKNIIIMRTDASGQPTTLKFNYKDVVNGKNLKQNIELKPGDTIVVP